MAAAVLLQNVTALLKNAAVITKYVDFIIKCDSYYKMQPLLQNVPMQCVKTCKNFHVSINSNK